MVNKNTLRILALTMAVLLPFMKFSVGVAAGSAWGDTYNPVERIDLAAEGIYNANRTGHDNVAGFEGYSRNVPGQKVHTGFSVNTNSCASCHMTHTAQGSGLIFQRSIYNTCSTCHFDSSMNTYNIHDDTTLPGGRFYDGDNQPESSRQGVSFHLATGAKELGDAPGAPDESEWDDPDNFGWWDQPFTCGSCHAPHGAYGERHFNMNINGSAQRYEGILLAPDQYDEEKYRPELLEETSPWLYYDNDSPYFEEYGLIIQHVINGTSIEDVTHLFSVHYAEGYVQIRDDLPLEEQQQIADVFDNENEDYIITYSQATVLDMEVERELDENDNVIWEESVYYGGTVAYCTACHQGYLDKNEQDQYVVVHGDREFPEMMWFHVIDENIAGLFSEEPDPDEFTIHPDGNKLKLEVNRDWENDFEQRLVCLTCHFAHGTDSHLMMDREVNNPMYLQDGAPEPPEETYNLRFGNRLEIEDMAWEVCFVCHEVDENDPEADTRFMPEGNRMPYGNYVQLSGSQWEPLSMEEPEFEEDGLEEGETTEAIEVEGDEVLGGEKEEGSPDDSGDGTDDEEIVEEETDDGDSSQEPEGEPDGSGEAEPENGTDEKKESDGEPEGDQEEEPLDDPDGEAAILREDDPEKDETETDSE
ncbi:cytochrome c3 family protein [Dethiobacter alkaliphilus]|uniref:cytochrome c3 family protein n=1 Tax=Dethiobacter alkaliphilus TaxID=427926 RepID=UPI002227FA97|nr:cytochrome c3 family protein [Dethiobacter alkaliphilus]MCW3491297.1 hypothetical protein [Dethiobacter alkaliphilus]